MSQQHERPWLEGAKAAVGEPSQQVDPTVPAPAAIAQPDADEPPEKRVTLADTLAKLTAILPGLKAAIERKPPVERLALRIDEVADSLGMSRRAIERERSAGRFPAADLHIGKAPLWRVETIRDWLDSKKGGRR
jgi:predicted DNA-binding transcriptional regulator AlpA